MKEWILHQFENFNILNFFLTTLFTVLWTRANTNKEIRTMSQQISKDFDRLSSEIKQAALMITQGGPKS